MKKKMRESYTRDREGDGGRARKREKEVSGRERERESWVSFEFTLIYSFIHLFIY